MSSGYYLLDHRQGDRTWSNRPAGQGHPDLLVVHTAESGADTDGEDGDAERVAHYFATTTRKVSAHSCIDSDSVVPCLPDELRAWHCRGFNARSWGAELCLSAAEWPRLPAQYVDGILGLAAAEYGYRCWAYGIPPRRIGLDEARAGKPGIAGHGDLDPGRRTDPGPEFPWSRFLELVEADVDRRVTSAAAEAATHPSSTGDVHLHVVGDQAVAVAQPAPAFTEGEARRLRRLARLLVDPDLEAE